MTANATQVLSRTYHIEKLNDKNYQPWRMTMEIILEQYNLLNIVDGTDVCPAIHDPTKALDVQTWKRRDLNARLELLLHMEDTLKQSVRTLTTSKQIWDRLEADYLHTDVMSQVANLKTLINMNMNENDDVDTFVKNWRLRLDDVILSGLSLPSSVQSALLLATLPL
mgnify:FL=1